jgi:hypothetical protein
MQLSALTWEQKQQHVGGLDVTKGVVSPSLYHRAVVILDLGG